MALANMKNIYCTVDEELLKKIDEYRRTQTPIPSRSEAIRQLIEKGLAPN
ncbi:MAG: ribbon-helix-helix domain-containing protein [Smithella sp.]|nr:ribbon-helix-helix domain-containing protein [Smithella sp.]